MPRVVDAIGPGLNVVVLASFDDVQGDDVQGDPSHESAPQPNWEMSFSSPSNLGSRSTAVAGINAEAPSAGNSSAGTHSVRPKAAAQRQARDYLHRALEAESRNALPLAIENYQRALRCDPTSRLVLVSFARLKHRISDFDGAIASYRQSLKLHPNDSVVLNDLGLCHARSGDLRNALRALRTAHRLEPESRRYINNLAVVLVATDRKGEAVEMLTDIYGPAIAHFNVGWILHRQGNDRAAKFHAKRALVLDPSLRRAKELFVQCSGSAPVYEMEMQLRQGLDAHHRSPDVAPEPRLMPISHLDSTQNDAQADPSSFWQSAGIDGS